MNDDLEQQILGFLASALDKIADEYEASGAVIPATTVATHLRRVASGLRSPTPPDQETST